MCTELTQPVKHIDSKEMLPITLGSTLPLLRTNNQFILGDEDFARQYIPNDDSKRLNEMPKVQKRRSPEPLEFYKKAYHDHHEAIAHAYGCGANNLVRAAMAEIASFFDVHYATVSRIVAKRKADTCCSG